MLRSGLAHDRYSLWLSWTLIITLNTITTSHNDGKTERWSASTESPVETIPPPLGQKTASSRFLPPMLPR